MDIYKVVKSDFDALQKRIKTIGKKLDKYGLEWRFETLGESVETVNVYRYSHELHCQDKISKAILDVVSYTFEMESLKLGEWKPIAVIEHSTIMEGGRGQNMVHEIDGAEILPEWWTAGNVCEHCRSNRQRNKTVILQNESGEYKQVGLPASRISQALTPPILSACTLTSATFTRKKRNCTVKAFRTAITHQPSTI
jgi:hypothetical protein